MEFQEETAEMAIQDRQVCLEQPLRTKTVRYIPVAGPPGPPGPPGQPGISITGPKGEPGNYPYGEPTYNLRPGTYKSFIFLSTFKS
jgi:hypothetical protein